MTPSWSSSQASGAVAVPYCGGGGGGGGRDDGVGLSASVALLCTEMHERR